MIAKGDSARDEGSRWDACCVSIGKPNTVFAHLQDLVASWDGRRLVPKLRHGITRAHRRREVGNMRGRSSLLDEVALYSALTLRLISQGPPEPRHGLAGAPGSRTVSDRAESHAIDKDGTVYITPRFCSALPVSPVRFNLRQQITGSRLRQLPRRLFRQLARPFGGRIRVFRIPGAPKVHAVRTRCSAEPLSFARTPFGKFR